MFLSNIVVDMLASWIEFSLWVMILTAAVVGWHAGGPISAIVFALLALLAAPLLFGWLLVLLSIREELTHSRH